MPQLTLYMLRPDLEAEDWGFRESIAEFREVPTRTINDLDVRLLVRQSDPTPPRWIRDLMSIVEGDGLSPSDLLSSHGAALLLIRYRGYRFILAYGTGRHAIDRSCTEPGFGLRVVANSVASSRVVSADTRGLGGRGRSQRTVMPSAGPLYELGIEPSEEWVRQLEGHPTVDFANAAAGGDSLRLRIRGFSLAKLGDKLSQVVEKYESSEYKKSYDFLDYFTRVRREDKALREGLDGVVTDLLRQRGDDIAFAAPDIPESLLANHYILRYRNYSSSELPELTTETVYGALEEWPLEDPLHSVVVEAFDSSGDVVGDSYKLFHYAAADILYGGQRFVLSAGVWFAVDESYIASVQRSIDSIPDLTDDLRLDTWDLGKHKDEGAYNSYLGRRGWKVLDKKNFPIERPNQKVEICDLLTPERQLVCVKRMSRSSSLSHLFAQGLVSTELLVANAEGYQDRVIDHLNEIRPGSTFGSRDDWTVVYALATTKAEPLPKSLYFFSKVNLDRTAQRLRSLGVRVALARISLKN